MEQMTATLKLYSMFAAANMLGYSLPFMNKICQRAFCSRRPFFVLKDENGKYFVEANSLIRYINACPDCARCHAYKQPHTKERGSLSGAVFVGKLFCA